MRLALILISILFAWQSAVLVTDTPAYIFPGPTDVAFAMYANISIIAQNLAITLAISVLALVAGVALAATASILMSYYSRFGPSAALVLAAFQAIPVVALAPYFLIWFGPGIAGRILMAVAVVFVPASFVMWNGLRRIDRDIGMLFKAHNVSRFESFKRYRLLLAVPFLLTAVELTASLSVIGAVIAELAGARDGIGALILRASYSMKTDFVFAVLVSAAIVSACLFKIIGLGTERASRRFAVTGIAT